MREGVSKKEVSVHILACCCRLKKGGSGSGGAAFVCAVGHQEACVQAGQLQVLPIDV